MAKILGHLEKLNLCKTTDSTNIAAIPPFRAWGGAAKKRGFGRILTERGFSLVELLVALLFTLLIMAGIATVFSASISSFHVSGDNVSSARRNRLGIEMLGVDINMAGMYMVDMVVLPHTVTNMPPFFVQPNMAVLNPGADDPATTDELYFYLDEPLPFEGTLVDSSAYQTAADMVLSGADLDPATNRFTINCLSNDYARQVRIGQVAIFKDFWEALYITNVSVSGSNVTITTGPSPNSEITGSGSTGLPSAAHHLDGSGVVFVRPGQIVRYRIEMVDLDPEKPQGIPCLVRNQGDYSHTGVFVAHPDSRHIVTENVSEFKVYLSANGGRDWAGFGYAGTGFEGWNGAAGIRGQIDSQLSTVGRPGYESTRADEHWFRSIPTLIRVDLTTRTATRRAEFSPGHDQLAYGGLTQTLIFMPRHFGLSMN